MLPDRVSNPGPCELKNWMRCSNIYCISSDIKWCFLPFPKDPKYLDPSYMTDLDIWNCFRRVKLISEHDFLRLI